jgi:2-polyprenyl-3-methyl-5-hydroxy-6-metoxy-1,4-benzoquinol methylase
MSYQTSVIDQTWPESELEHVKACPFCGAQACTKAYEGVKDWSFDCSPGEWAFWRCQDCAALYLNPRPTKDTIGRAYERYYTHDGAGQSYLSSFKKRLINEFFYHSYGINLQPRLSLPHSLSWVLGPLKHKLVAPFGLDPLMTLPRGVLMDIGCGNGEFLNIAQQLGWSCTGLELDPAAVSVARQAGLVVEIGSYEKLSEFPEHFDCIVCSHVLEHVHQPGELIRLLYDALKPGGTLLLSAPNALSKAGCYFGPYWRGLEAPRHLAIPAVRFIRDHLSFIGFRVSQRVFKTFPTIAASLAIRKRVLEAEQRADQVRNVRSFLGRPTADEVDFIELVCFKSLTANDNDGADE